MSSAFQLLAAASIIPSPHNPRKRFDQAALDRLAASIKDVGIIEPLIVRPNGAPDKYELVAGERRYRAGQLAHLAQFPVIVRDLSDQQAREIQIIENLQREDVHPMDEGVGYRELLNMRLPGGDKPLYTVKLIAERVKMSIEHVYKRMKLADLIPEAQEALWADKISAGHATEICVLQVKDQAEALKYCLPVNSYQHKPTVKDLRDWIREEKHSSLSRACFDPKAGSLLPEVGPCTTCSKRSGNTPGFEERPRAMRASEVEDEIDRRRKDKRPMTEEEQEALYNKAIDDDAVDPNDPDVCTDPHCFQQKTKAHLTQIELSLKARGDYLKVSERHSWNKNELAGGVLPDHRWEEAKKGEPSKPALVVEGNDRGKVIQVKVKPPRPVQKERSPQDYKAEQERQQQARKNEQAIRFGIVKAIGDQVRHLTNADVTEVLAELVNHQTGALLCSLHGLTPGANPRKVLLDRVPKMPPREFARLVMEASLAQELVEYCCDPKDSTEHIAAAAKRYKVNPDAIRKRLAQPAAAAAPKGKARKAGGGR